MAIHSQEIISKTILRKIQMLPVNTSGKSVELGEIHIDNIAPECNVLLQ